MTMWIGYAKSGKEFEVAAALGEIGITCHVARKIEAIRRGKRRRPEPVESPFLPNYVFIDVSVDRFLELSGIKHLAQTKTMVPDKERKWVFKFLRNVSDTYDRERARIDAGERVSMFSEGDMLKIVGGPLAGNLVRFRHIVHGDNQAFDRIKGDVDLMGQVAGVELDPLDVRAAE